MYAYETVTSSADIRTWYAYIAFKILERTARPVRNAAASIVTRTQARHPFHQPHKKSFQTRTTQLSFYYTTMTANGVIPAAAVAAGGGGDDGIIPEEGYCTVVNNDDPRRLHVGQTDSGMTGVRMVRKGCFRPKYTVHMYCRCLY
jgi:hypothetical protein